MNNRLFKLVVFLSAFGLVAVSNATTCMRMAPANASSGWSSINGDPVIAIVEVVSVETGCYESVGCSSRKDGEKDYFASKVRVVELFKGPDIDGERLYSSIGSPLGRRLRPGHRYLVYTSKQAGRYRIGFCTSRAISEDQKADSEIDLLRAISKDTDGRT